MYERRIPLGVDLTNTKSYFARFGMDSIAKDKV